MKKIILLFMAVCLLPTVFADELVTVPSLLEEFQSDSDAFREKHIGNKVTISAVVADTHISIYLTPVVSLVEKVGDEAKIICVLPRLEANKLSNFKKGQKVTMSGTLYAAREEKIVIKQCQVEE